MIRLTKHAKPDVLVEKEAAWTKEYDDFKNGLEGVPKAAEVRYRHADIKTTLRTESCDKCIYCESKISHVFPGETEHILPSSRRRDLVVAWDNLAYVCKECNREKGAYYDVNEPLINPYIEDPDDFLLFLGPMVYCKGVNGKGHLTILQLKLWRTALIERRKERIEQVLTLIQLCETKPEGPTKRLIWQQIQQEAAPDKEYSAFVREFIRARCG